MTTAQVTDETENVNQLPDEDPIGEAGGVAWVDLHGTKSLDGISYDVKISLTSRANTPITALTELLAAVKFAQDNFKMYPFARKASGASAAPKNNNVSSAPAIPVSAPPVPSSTGSNPVEPTYEDIQPSQGGIVNAVKMSVVPRADGKTQVGFFEAGHQYADINCVMTPAQIVALLSPTGVWTEEHFKVIATYEPIAYKIAWQPSTKLNKYNKPYKNVVSITK